MLYKCNVYLPVKTLLYVWDVVIVWPRKICAFKRKLCEHAKYSCIILYENWDFFNLDIADIYSIFMFKTCCIYVSATTQIEYIEMTWNLNLPHMAR